MFSLDNFELENGPSTGRAGGVGAPPDEGGSAAAGGVVDRACPVCGAVYEGDDLYCRADGTRLRLATPLEQGRTGEVIDGRYTVIGPLGEGAMGCVYRALQRGLEREVAIKVLKRTPGNERHHARRFLREVRTVSRLSHPNIVTVHDFGETQTGELYLAMELLRGATLRQVLDAEAPLTATRAILLVGQVCEALHAAHTKGIIHRDLKPTNVMVVDADEVSAQHVKLLDFGLVKLSDFEGADSAITRTGHICGTPLYMSPEQALGMELDARSDLYAVGLLVYEMLTGVAPFAERAVVDILRAHVQEDAPRFSLANPDVHVHPALEAAVFQALAKDAGERPDSALELKRQLESALQQSRVSAAAATVSLAGAAPCPDRPPAAEASDEPFRLDSPRPTVTAATAANAANAATVAVPPASNPEAQAEVGRDTAAASPAEVGSRGVAESVAIAAEAPFRTTAGLRPLPSPEAPGGPTPQPPASGAAVLRRPFHVPTRRGLPPVGAGGVAGRRTTGRPPSAEGATDHVDPRPRPRRAAHAQATRPPDGAARSLSPDAAAAAAARQPTPAAATRSSIDEQVEAAGRLLQVVGQGPRRPWCELNLAELLRRQGRAAEAERHAREALRYLKGSGNARLQGFAAELLADLAEAGGDLARAIDWLGLAIDSWRTVGNDARLALSCARCGAMLFRRKQHAAARACLTEAVELDRTLGHDERLGADLRGLGSVAEAMGDRKEAAQMLRDALEIEVRRGDAAGQAWCCHHLGRIAEHRGNWSEARDWHERALAQRLEQNDDVATAKTLQRLGGALVHLERYAEARTRLAEALAIHERRADEAATAMALRLIGDVSRRVGDWSGAASQYDRSEAILRRIGSPLAGGRMGFVDVFRSDHTEDALHRALDKMRS